MSYEMKLEQGLSQQLNQFQVQSLKILSFDNYELEKFLQDEYAENPQVLGVSQDIIRTAFARAGVKEAMQSTAKKLVDTFKKKEV